MNPNLNLNLNSKLYTEQEILEIYQNFLAQKIFAVNKSLYWTSQDTISFLKNFLKVKKIGHGGTLDPLASGILIVAINDATKKLADFLNGDKNYYALIELNKKSATGDGEGEIIETQDVQICLEDVENAIKWFDDLKYLQAPHRYSAVKVQGKKLYEYSRDGINIQVEARKVHLKKLELVKFEKNLIEVNFTVSKGFYVRSFAEEFAEKLKTVGYLKKLIRTECKGFILNKQTVDVQKLKKSLKVIKRY